MLLFYIRHGHPTYNPDCLTEAGFKEAEALIKRTERIKPDKIFASTSNRAIQTARPTAKMLNREITLLDWCNEGHAWGEFTVKNENGDALWCFQHTPTVELFASDEIQSLGHKWMMHPFFKETRIISGINRIQSETDAFMEELGYRRKSNGIYSALTPNDDRIALFAHQGFGMAFLSCLLGIPYPFFCTHFDMTYTGITVIELDGNDACVPKMLQLSNDSHLLASDMETVYNNKHSF